MQAGPKASALIPDLQDLGFRIVQQGPEPAVPAGIDSAAAIYQGKQGQQIQVRIRVERDEGVARKEYQQFITLLKNPPAEFLGGQAKFVDAASPSLGDEHKSYKTESVDAQGFTAYTDIYRKGRTVVLIQVVDRATDGMPARQEAGERALKAAP